MTEAHVSLLGGDGAATIRNAVTRCLAELPGSSADQRSTAVIAGIGTTAPHALKGALLLDALARQGVRPAEATPFADPAALIADETWELALVLSPWKRDVATAVTTLTAAARRTGVVDTIVRRARSMIGVNTNSWAAQAAMETVLGGQTPASVLVLGSGGSSNSVALGCRRAWPTVRLVGSARNSAALDAWASHFDAEAAAPAELSELFDKAAPTLIVNTTTWGETDASESTPFAFDFAELTAPGNGYFDLNNRVSTLQTSALSAGMNVMSGTFMQRATNACRAALLTARAR
jgi:shikimate dehydrogenase